ncbi:MAG: hypothetical protein VX815_15570, partial [Gemmatimonadota bacterium]|nr:hypothetical protein [Gemmatimonadota bacterium]
MNRGIANPGVAGLLLACATLACAESAPEPFEQLQGTAPAAAFRSLPGRSYERNLVFATVAADSLIMVPWLFETTTRPGT